MVSRVIPVEAFDLVLLGATGDLAHRKILPGLFRRFAVGQMPEDARIIGVARRPMDAAAFRASVEEALAQFAPQGAGQQDMCARFLSKLHYTPVDAAADTGWAPLKDLLREDVVRAFYLSVSPSLFGSIAAGLARHGLTNAQSRIVVEKPFGHDLQTAAALNQDLRLGFHEHQIYRIDHYLGKETVQNLMALRFANSLWEPLWNANHVDHVQITVAESLGVQGRGAYYDNSGAMRDMVQNHLMQLLCLTAMEPPARFDPDAVRDEKLKVIRALRTTPESDIVRGQYRGSDPHDSYRDHAGAPHSLTESFIALKVNIGNWRWAGAPFYLRTGKRMRARASEIAVVFRAPPHMIFPDIAAHPGNVLVIRLQPDEGITLVTTIKEPGLGGMRLREASLDMTFAEAFSDSHTKPQDAYERLVMDVIRGDQTLFMRGDEVEAAWAWVDPIIERWERAGTVPLAYDAGSSGPEDALRLLHADGRRWRAIG